MFNSIFKKRTVKPDATKAPEQLNGSFFFKHQRDAVNAWRWPHFSPEEVGCRQITKLPNGQILDCGCGGEVRSTTNFLDKLERMRTALGPMPTNSIHRCSVHNKNSNGKPKSYHLTGEGADVRITKTNTREKIHAVAREAGLKGVLDYNTFVHVDDRAVAYYADMRGKK